MLDIYGIYVVHYHLTREVIFATNPGKYLYAPNPSAKSICLHLTRESNVCLPNLGKKYLSAPNPGSTYWIHPPSPGPNSILLR